LSLRDRRRLAAVVLAGFAAFLGLHAPQPLLPVLKELFHVSTSRVSLIICVSTAAVALTAPLIGLLADRWGRRRIIIPAALLLSLPSTLVATSTTFGQLLFWRFWQGVFTPAVSATTVAYINEEWSAGAGTAMSAFVAGSILGGYSGRTLAAVVAAHSSWRAEFLLLGILNLIGGLLIWAWLPRDRKSRAAPKISGSREVIWSHLRNPALLATYAAGFCVLFTVIAAFTYINFHLSAAPFHWSTSSLGLLFTVYLVAAPVIMTTGRWIDRWGYQTALIAALVGSMAGILLTLIPNALAIVAGLTVFSSGAFVAQSAATSYIGIAAKHARAAAVGLYVTAYYVGGSFGAALPGIFWNGGGWPACVASIVLAQGFTAVLVGRFWRTRTRLVDPVTVSME
jgi:MFS transporter, YNFM family, putative membrane transport protein